MINSIEYTVFTPGASEVGKITEKIVFWLTLEAPREKTLYLRELLMIFKVAVNNIVDIIHFDQNSIRCHWK